MGPGLLLFVAAIYLIVAADYLGNDRYGMALAFVAYALANVGFALDAWQ
jgi:hypothetical protein